ncbi:MAG: hypothetical protein KatS3mg062_1087 [Tepidiforma sp.]|nr:MAG: hypothetical protein KatS3mg062_1087 [Tepidiforma sp.]
MRRHHFLAAAAALGVAALVPIATVLGDDSGPGSRVESATALTTTFTYQGRLTDGGSPANGTYDLRFILYDAETGGSQVGSTITRDDVAVANGLFSVELDFGAAAFRGDARWLEIAVRPGSSTGAYTVLSPRQPVSPAPYALFAAEAGTVKVPLTVTGTSAAPGGIIEVTQQGAGAAIRAAAATGTGGTFSGQVALEVDGPLKVSGASPFAFQHTVDLAGGDATTCPSTGNAVSYITNPQVFGKPNLLVFVTPENISSGGLTAPVAVTYQATAPPGCSALAGAWALYTADGSNLADGQVFNILVISK